MRAARLRGAGRNPRIAAGNAKMLGKNKYIHKLVDLICISDDIHAKKSAGGSWLRMGRVEMLGFHTGEYQHGHDK